MTPFPHLCLRHEGKQIRSLPQARVRRAPNGGCTNHPGRCTGAALSGYGVNRMTTPTKPWKRLIRRLGHDSNPLRRRSDVIDAWLVPVAIVVFLALCPLVLTLTGSWMRAATAGERQAQADWHPVTATLVHAVPRPVQGPYESNVWLTWTPASWTANGMKQTGKVPARFGSAAGTKVVVWLDSVGRVHQAPLSKSQATDRVAVARVLGVAALAVLLAIMILLAHRALDRRRLADWESAWLSVGPTWSRRR